MAKAIDSVVLRKKGETNGLPPGSGTPGRLPYLAVTGGSGRPYQAREPKTRVIGTGQH